MAAGQASVKALSTVDAVIDLLNVALTSVLMATPVTAGELAAGVDDVTVGRAPTPGAPSMGSLPALQAASTRVAKVAIQALGNVLGRDVMVMTVGPCVFISDVRERIEGSVR